MLQTRKDKLKFFLFAYWHDPRWQKFVGAAIKIWDLSQNLVNEGIDVTLFLPKLNFNKKSYNIKIVEIPFLNLPFLRMFTFNICLSFILIIFFLKIRPDVVWIRRMGSVIPGLYAKFSRSIFFFEVNDDPYRKDFNEGSWLFFKLKKFLSEKQDEINIWLSDKAFVITKEIINKIRKRNPAISENKLEEMPSGANVDLFRPLNKKQCKVNLKLDTKKSYILFIGTLLKHQGVDILIKAAAAIIEKVPSSFFIIIGEGPMKETWINDVQTMELNNHFIFTGQIEYKEVPFWIGSSDLCVAPFKKSAGLRSPVKIFDYMSCARAVIASKIQGTTDVFRNTGAIKIIKPNDPKLLADSIIELLNNREKAKEMGQKGRELVVSKYDRKKMSQMIIETALACSRTI